jgi:hypothetical protein
MEAQVTRDSTDPPFFDVVVAQDLRLEFRGNRHDQILFDVEPLEESDGDAETLGERTAGSDIHTNGTATPIAAESNLKSSVCLSSPSKPRTANHRTTAAGNSDASHSFAVRDSGGHAQRG